MCGAGAKCPGLESAWLGSHPGSVLWDSGFGLRPLGFRHVHPPGMGAPGAMLVECSLWYWVNWSIYNVIFLYQDCAVLHERGEVISLGEEKFGSKIRT